jgi:hypothetical protein
MNLIKKILLFSIFNIKTPFVSIETFRSKVFDSKTLSLEQQKEIFYENYLYKIICKKLNTYEEYKFYKTFNINIIPEGLQQVNIENKTIDLDHNNYYYFEIININQYVISNYNKTLFQKHIKNNEEKPLENSKENENFSEKIMNIILTSFLKSQIIGTLEASTLFRIKKSSLKDKFKKINFIYAVESVQDGEKDNISNKCMINTLKDCFVSYYYELKQYNNKEVLQNYYEILSMFCIFLNNLSKFLDTLSEEDAEKLKTFILNPENSMNSIFFIQEIVPKIIQNISIEKVRGKEDLSDEDFNKIISEGANALENILIKQHEKSPTSMLLIALLSGIFNSILLRNNNCDHLMPYLLPIHMNHKVFNLSRFSLNLIVYIPMHIQYIYCSIDEKYIKVYKKFMIDWYEKFDKNSVNKTFNEHKYKITK